jgi:aminoglycoside phosphotransferase (APT) family kinase protein
MTLTPPWWSDRGELDAARVAATIASQFPALRPVVPRFLARGWDHDAWLVNDAWVFRFPRRRRVAEECALRRPLAARIAAALPIPVPRIEFAGEPDSWFPHPYAAHRFLAGEPADRFALAESEEDALARRLGPVLAALHELDTAGLAVPVEGDRNAERRLRAIQRADAFRAVMPPACVKRWEPVLRGALDAPPVYEDPFRATHNDLNAEHLLLDPETHELVAVIDWNDAALGDPATDFIGLWIWGGERLVRRVLAYYPRHWDEAFVARAYFGARCLAPLWIAEAAHYGDAAEVARLRAWFLSVWEPREGALDAPPAAR